MVVVRFGGPGVRQQAVNLRDDVCVLLQRGDVRDQVLDQPVEEFALERRDAVFRAQDPGLVLLQFARDVAFGIEPSIRCFPFSN